jgi:hypothetical protein
MPTNAAHENGESDANSLFAGYHAECVHRYADQDRALTMLVMVMDPPNRNYGVHDIPGRRGK